MDPTALAEKLRLARVAYYAGEPTLTDSAYDLLEEELRLQCPSHPLLAKIGAPTTGQWPEVRHLIPMGSLNKVTNRDELATWCRRVAEFAPDADFILMHKLDGASIELVYDAQTGCLQKAVSRGDGVVGDDLTRNVRLMTNVPLVIPPVPGIRLVTVRGEVLMLHETYMKRWLGYGKSSSARNLAAGLMRRMTDSEACGDLTVVAYQLYFDGDSLANKLNELLTLANWGFYIPGYERIVGDGRLLDEVVDAIDTAYQRYIDGARGICPWEIDGLVLSLFSKKHREAGGFLAGRPGGEVAYKFPSPSAVTTLKNVRYQLSDSGRLTPVAEFDPVELCGASVCQASLHNVATVASLNSALGQGDPTQLGSTLYVGDRIIVSRRNDVIPYVEAVIERGSTSSPLAVPTVCERCNSTLEFDGAYLVCPNDACPSRTEGAIKKWLSELNILYFGDNIVNALIDAGWVTDVSDLYFIQPGNASRLTNKETGRRLGDSVTKAFANLHAKKELTLPEFVSALGIPSIGRTIVQTAMEAGFTSINDMKDTARYGELVTAIGPERAHGLVQGLMKRSKSISHLLGAAGITFRTRTGHLSGKTFCLTGFRDAALTAKLEEAGAIVKDGVSKNLSYLVAVDPNAESSKTKAAKKHDVSVIGASEAYALCANSSGGND